MVRYHRLDLTLFFIWKNSCVFFYLFVHWLTIERVEYCRNSETELESTSWQSLKFNQCFQCKSHFKLARPNSKPQRNHWTIKCKSLYFVCLFFFYSIATATHFSSVFMTEREFNCSLCSFLLYYSQFSFSAAFQFRQTALCTNVHNAIWKEPWRNTMYSLAILLLYWINYNEPREKKRKKYTKQSTSTSLTAA